MIKRKISLLLVITVMLSSLLIGVFADNDIKSVVANIVNYSFKYKGRAVEFTNTRLDFLSYNNKIYVPIETVADLLNVAARHDKENKVIEIGSMSGSGVSLLDVPETGYNDVKYFIKTIDPDVLTLNKNFFDSGLVLLSPRTNSSHSRTFSLGKQYETLSFSSIVSTATKSDNVVIKFIDADRKTTLRIIDVSNDKALNNYSIKVLGIDKLQILIETGGKSISKYIMGDIYLK